MAEGESQKPGKSGETGGKSRKKEAARRRVWAAKFEKWRALGCRTVSK
jgi:hypothetical protein